MRVIIKKSQLKGKVSVPPSKSCAHRLLIGAALSCGESKIENIAQSQDVLATAECLAALGAGVSFDEDSATVFGMGKNMNKKAVLNCRESGSTLRFLIPLALLSGGAELFGTQKLISRGVGVYKDLFESRGASIECCESKISVSGELSSGKYLVRGDISSQFITGLLFALPLVGGDSEIEVSEPFESKSYVNITIDILKKFGVEIEGCENNVFKIKGGQSYSPLAERVEADWSNGAFFHAINALGGELDIEGLDNNSLQGDKVAVEYFKALEGRNAVLDMTNCPDLAPIAFTVAAAKNGATFIGTRRLAIKESDRAKAMAEELSKFGADICVESDRVIVRPSVLRAPTEILSSHNDHRVAMSLAVLLSKFGGEIEGAEAVKKSFPDFFEYMRAIGLEVEYDG